MFIIEGSDCLGKTTIAKKMVGYMRKAHKSPNEECISYRHMTRPDETTFNFSTDYLELMDHWSIQDRFHLGALAYHKDKMSIDTLRWIEGQLYIRGSFILLIYTDEMHWYENHLKNIGREEMFDVPTLMEANIKFMSIRETVHIDAVFNISTGIFPTDEIIEFWADEWYKRVCTLIGIEKLLQDLPQL